MISHHCKGQSGLSALLTKSLNLLKYLQGVLFESIQQHGILLEITSLFLEYKVYYILRHVVPKACYVNNTSITWYY